MYRYSVRFVAVFAILTNFLLVDILYTLSAIRTDLHVFSHAHNDYEHPRPLLDALDNRFYSVEADIWLEDGRIVVGHDKDKYHGTLQELYLNPLQQRVKEKGSVHGDGMPFYLWVDIKDGRQELRPILQNLLSQYEMVTVFQEGGTKEKAVTVILTGDARSKQAYVEEYPTRYACRDSNDYKPEDPPADGKWTWYALKWSNYVKWYGEESIEPETHKVLESLVRDIHAKGRKVRFWSAPDTPHYWDAALKAGVDLINTDKLEELNQFLDENNEIK